MKLEESNSMKEDNRRSFVKKSLATSMTFTFGGLIRAHGEEGGGNTTSDPWGCETTFATTEGLIETWATTVVEDETTTPSPWGEETTIEPTTEDTTDCPTTEETTIETTVPLKIEYFGYRIRVWPYWNGFAIVWTPDRNSISAVANPITPPLVAIDHPPMAAGVQLSRDRSMDTTIHTTEDITGLRHIDTIKTAIPDYIDGVGLVTSYQIVVSYKNIFPSNP